MKAVQDPRFAVIQIRKAQFRLGPLWFWVFSLGVSLIPAASIAAGQEPTPAHWRIGFPVNLLRTANFRVARDTTGTSQITSIVGRRYADHGIVEEGGNLGFLRERQAGRVRHLSRPASVEVNCDQLGCCHLFRKPSDCNHSANRSIQ